MPETSQQEVIRDQAIDIPALAEDLVGIEGLFPRDGSLALALYRLLAEGDPVSVERLAARGERSRSEVADWVAGSRVELDERGEVVALLGLSLRPTKQILEIDGRTLYAWCAGDVLYIHDLLGRPLRARSTDPITGEEIAISLEHGRVREVEPSGTVLSWPRADFPMGDAVVPAACGPINFFGSEESGRAFTERAEGIFLLTLEQGLELMRLVNRTVFGSALESDAPLNPTDKEL
jgi:alkylmercury lyase